MSLSQEARSDLHPWVNNVTFAFRNITQTNPDLTLTTDASTIGWGQYVGIKKPGNYGFWKNKLTISTSYSSH